MRKARLAAMLLLCAASPMAAQRTPDFAAFDKYVAKALQDWHGGRLSR